MRFAFVRPIPFAAWGGDLKVVQDLQKGLRALGHTSFVTNRVQQACNADVICFTISGVDHTSDLNCMRLIGRDYVCIPFHEDELLFRGASFGFFYYVTGILGQNYERDHSFSLKSLIERPHLVFYFSSVYSHNSLTNYDFLQSAKCLIAESPTEEKTLLRDVPGCNTRVVFWGPGFVGDMKEDPDDRFLRFVGLRSGSYILQVGRIHVRKNQLATLLATWEIDLPLVFIAMDQCKLEYRTVFFDLAQRRRAPTYVISRNVRPQSFGSLQILSTMDGKIFPKEMLLSAFAHAGLHLHPAFYELPGATYLEAACLGVPTIASSWGSLRDYFTDLKGQYTLDDRIEYALPYDIGALKNLVEKKFGQKYPRYPLHPTFQRGTKEMAIDFLRAIGH